MDEITHQMVYRDLEGFYFNIKTGHVRFPSGKWGTSTHSVEALTESGWKVIPVHVELENK